jgi:PTH2 family peptidyl-tRNA hydrolase
MHLVRVDESDMTFVEGVPDQALLEARAREQQIPTCLVHDAGRTVIPAGTITCLGLGPAATDVLEPLTGTLRLV